MRHAEKHLRFAMVTTLTLLRLALAPSLLVLPYDTGFFWTCYLVCGLSDMIDGTLARRLHVDSDFGSRLDSISDLVFLIAAAFAFWPQLTFPPPYLVCAGAILLIRLASLAMFAKRIREFRILHTWGNKASGLALFLLPLINYPWYWIICIAVCGSAALHELALAISWPLPKSE